MVDALGSDKGESESGTKPNFIGRVVTSEYQSDDYPVKQEYLDEDESREDYFEHLYEIEVLKVLGNDESAQWDNLHEFSLKITRNWDSKWMVAVGHIENIHGRFADNEVDSYEDLADFLEGQVYEFREIGWDEDEEFVWEESPDQHSVMLSNVFQGSENPPNELIVPQDTVDEDTLMDMGVEQSAEDAEVEEVDLGE